MLDYAAIGKKIRQFRKANSLSQEQLAERVWISTTHMSHIETGATKLSLPVLVDIANVLNVGTDELLENALGARKEQAVDSIQQVLNSCTGKQAQILEKILVSAKEALEAHM